MARAATTSDVFNAIAEPQRRDILTLLRSGERPVTQVAHELGLSQPGTSKHLKVLREVGLVRDRRAGKQRLYALDAGALREVHEWSGGFEQFWQGSFERLDAYVQEMVDEREEPVMQTEGTTESDERSRDVVVSHLVRAAREVVFEAFTEVRHLSRWWGPEGFTTTTKAFDFAVGGAWQFEMRGPDGTVYPEWIGWTEIDPPHRIAFVHGEYEDDPRAFRSVLTFIPSGESTTVELRTVFLTVQQRDEAVEKFGAVEGGRQTLAKLADYAADLAAEAGA